MNNELYHHGIKGMKWGKRKSLPTSDIRNKVNATKAEYKKTGKAYTKSFNKAYNRALSAYSPIKKHRQANDARWKKALSDADKFMSAKSAYKQANKERKNAIKSEYKKLNKKASFGEKLLYNNATRKKASKYIVDHNMTVAEANKRAKSDAWRNTAIAMIVSVGGVTMSTLYRAKH